MILLNLLMPMLISYQLIVLILLFHATIFIGFIFVLFVEESHAKWLRKFIFSLISWSKAFRNFVRLESLISELDCEVWKFIFFDASSIFRILFAFWSMCQWLCIVIGLLFCVYWKAVKTKIKWKIISTFLRITKWPPLSLCEWIYH